jgi:hypothetical protein
MGMPIYDTLDDDANVHDRLEPYRSIAEKSQTVLLTKHSEGKMAHCQARVACGKKNDNVKVINVNKHNPTKRVERSDSGKARSYVDQAEAVTSFVLGQWNGGDPATRQEVYDMLRVRDDCCEGFDFFKSYFGPGKEAALAGFLTRCLSRMNFSIRKNSIGQKVPEKWHEEAEANIDEIRKVLKEVEVDIVVNAD